jgi:hypothetical protein
MEHRLFDPANPPDWLDPEWWRDREHCDHLGSPTGAHVARLQAAERHARIAALAAGEDNDAAPVCDLGAGDGALLSLLPASLRAKSWGYDIIRDDVNYANNGRGVKVYLRNVAKALGNGTPLHLAPVVVLTEVLEHMADPHGFLALLHARPEVRYVVASSPFDENPERHEWNHAWCWDTEGYRAMFNAAGFRRVGWEHIEWSQVWTFEAVREQRGLTTEEAVAALEDEREGWSEYAFMNSEEHP